MAIIKSPCDECMKLPLCINKREVKCDALYYFMEAHRKAPKEFKSFAFITREDE